MGHSDYNVRKISSPIGLHTMPTTSEGPVGPGSTPVRLMAHYKVNLFRRYAVTLSIERDVTRCSVRGDHIVIHSVPYCLRVRDVVMKEINLKQRESCSIQVITIVPTGFRGDKDMAAH